MGDPPATGFMADAVRPDVPGYTRVAPRKTGRAHADSWTTEPAAAAHRDTGRRRSSDPELIVLLNGRVAGSVYREAGGGVRFVYDDEWREDPRAYPLSLSLPLAAAEHPYARVRAYLLGLLPDNAHTLERWRRMYSVADSDPVALLAHVGADCAGAVQLVPPELVDHVAGAAQGPPRVDWLSEAEVASRLRTLRTGAVPGSTPAGRFTLAGSHPKIALLEEDGRWGEPLARAPTNRILKPPARDDAFAENEHLCLGLAHRLGLPAARSRVRELEDSAGVEVAIVVERFDRERRDDRDVRIHQEDCCQALGIDPAARYEHLGGPSAAQLFTLIQDASADAGVDTARFLDVLALNWIIAGTDAHAKNYALLHAEGPRVRLAPFYDMASYLPYDATLYRVRVAMKIGGECLVRGIGRRHWVDFAHQVGLDADLALYRIRSLAERVPDAAIDVAREAEGDGLAPEAVYPLADLIAARAAACGQLMG